MHGWTLKPPGFKKGDEKAWPILLLIHGGPEGAWEDQWSNRWNPNSECFVQRRVSEANVGALLVFAQQGYFVVAINPTGSTSFGQGQSDAYSRHDAYSEDCFRIYGRHLPGLGRKALRG